MKPEEIRKLIATLSDLEKSVEKAARSFEQIHADLQAIVASMAKPAPVEQPWAFERPAPNQEELCRHCGWQGIFSDTRQEAWKAGLPGFRWFCPLCNNLLGIIEIDAKGFAKKPTPDIIDMFKDSFKPAPAAQSPDLRCGNCGWAGSWGDAITVTKPGTSSVDMYKCPKCRLGLTRA